MAPTLCEKCFKTPFFFVLFLFFFVFFNQKAPNFVWFRLYDFVQITLACVTNIDKGMYGETSDF